ncbi:MAG: bifunctional adenosylcobinamide kinase/adenosylcobinamide-phosphate guanylyltransferase [cyanobacterium endosymbiont of Epithemia adnata isolate EadnSB Bon19]
MSNGLEQDGLTWIETMAQFLDRLETTPVDVVLVAEEAGWGVIPTFPFRRTFRDRLGNLTRHLGAIAKLT